MSQALPPITRSVSVRCSPERAFEVFTAEMDSWWPVETHSRAASEYEDQGVKVERVEFQGRVGGRILEHVSSGLVLPWGEVLAWEPPRRFVLAWKPHGREQPPTEVEVTFTPAQDGTEVVLMHRAWERLQEVPGDVAKLHGTYAGGWVQTLFRFAEAANRDAA
jgi:uncharacterized protein YndB with AHSA1/START domain